MAETILIVDDEEAVRRTFADWLAESGLPVVVRAVDDAEGALQFANENAVDLAILDWNLGSGSDGLQLLEDLVVFQPNIVAILITGFAHQATPLQALRMGVRDYLDKNQDLTRDTFLASVRRQLDAIRPAKQQRQFQRGLLLFRTAVEEALPVVQASAAISGPGSPSEALRPFIQLAVAVAGAKSGYLILRQLVEGEAETVTAGDAEGTVIPWVVGHFPKSLAYAALVAHSPLTVSMKDPETFDMLRPQEFERKFDAIMAVPLVNEPRVQAVLHLADGPFATLPKPTLKLLGTLGGEIVQRIVGDRQRGELVLAALTSAREVGDSLSGVSDSPVDDASAHSHVLERLGATLTRSPSGKMARETVRIAERIRDLNARYGPAALRHVERLLESTEQILGELNPPLMD